MEGLTEFEFWRYNDEQFAEFDEGYAPVLETVTNLRVEGEPEPELDMNSTVSSAPDNVRVQALWMLVDAKNQRIDMLERMIDGAGYDVPDDDIIN